MANKNLTRAKSEKNDEFYTQLADIEKELIHYKQHFYGKVVYLNCDTIESNFYKYFVDNQEELGIKKIYRTSYSEGIDFRSDLALDFLKEADIVVTNPPFSLFREYIAQLMEYNKKFLVVGNMNAITYKEIFPLIKNGDIWLGVNSNKTLEFKLPDSYTKWNKIENGSKYGKVPAITWYTNLEHHKRNEKLILYKKYNAEEYPKYDNYDAIEVSKTKDIPIDYSGAMGVPISFLTKYNPEQFEIVGQMATTKIDEFNQGYPFVNGKKIYARILIKNKRL